MVKDHTEAILESVVNGYVDELKKLPRGDPAHMRVVARLKAARKDLADYQKSKKKRGTCQGCGKHSSVLRPLGGRWLCVVCRKKER